MDMDLVLIFSFVTVLTIVLGLSINGVVSKVLAHRRWEKEEQRIAPQMEGSVSQISDRAEMIEDRLRVLERLATDRGQLLSDEIEALRDRAITHESKKETA